MAISPYDQETRQRAVRLYFEELDDGASSKAAALRAVEAVIGIKTSTIRNWVRAEEKKVDVAVEQSGAEKDAELALRATHTGTSCGIFLSGTRVGTFVTGDIATHTASQGAKILPGWLFTGPSVCSDGLGYFVCLAVGVDDRIVGHLLAYPVELACGFQCVLEGGHIALCASRRLPDDPNPVDNIGVYCGQGVIEVVVLNACEDLVVLGVPAVCPQIIPVVDRVAGPSVGEVLIGLEVALQLSVQGLQELPRLRGRCLGAGTFAHKTLPRQDKPWGR